MGSLAQLEQDIQSDDWATALAASDALAAIGGADVLEILIPLLSSPSRWTRNAAALALREIGDNAAREPLIRAIADPLTQEDRGALVRALQPLDCSDYLRLLFHLALTGTFEVQNHALHILYDQVFWYTQNDLVEMQAELETYAQRQGRRPDTDLLINDLAALLDDLRQQTHLCACE